MDARRTLRGRSVRIALDTNVLAYAEGINGAERRDAALALVRRLPQEAAVVPVQVLGELSMCSSAKAENREATPAMLC